MLLSAAIVFTLGALHLSMTFAGPKLRPRDPDLQARMEAISPRITRETTMWKAWIGFNATHSLGAMLFGVVYGYLALARSEVLFGSAFLLAVGGVLLLAYTVIARKYFFNIPFRGIVLATICYALAVLW